MQCALDQERLHSGCVTNLDSSHLTSPQLPIKAQYILNLLKIIMECSFLLSTPINSTHVFIDLTYIENTADPFVPTTEASEGRCARTCRWTRLRRYPQRSWRNPSDAQRPTVVRLFLDKDFLYCTFSNCFKGFNSNSSLVVHQVLHTNVKICQYKRECLGLL